jgi:hypothetical protein
MPFWRRDNKQRCKHMFKLTGASLEISGINVNFEQLQSPVTIDRKLLNTVTEILLTLDNLQYQLCISSEEIGEEETKFAISYPIDTENGLPMSFSSTLSHI